jgi:mono/diheme cytochrome c family protein
MINILNQMKVFKKILTVAGVVVALVVAAAAGFFGKAYFSVDSRINHRYEVRVESLPVSGDSAVLAYGTRLATAKGCRDCHGDDLGGKVFIDDGKLGKFYAKNLTKGSGGLPRDYSVRDWVLALKHGIRRDGKPLLIMPSHEYTHLSREDMSALVSYLITIPAVDREIPDPKVGPLAYILTELGKLPLIPAEMIDHSADLVTGVQAEVSPEFGKYLSSACQGCHRSNMKGGDPIAPGFPVVADISSTGHIGKWTEEQFMTTLRTGKTPEGKDLKPNEMPWNMTAAYTDTELKALFAYLRSI